MSPLAGLRARAPIALRQRMNYSTYKSPFGPKYKTQPHIAGFTAKDAYNYGILAGGFGGVAGIFALFFFAEVPRVRDDIIKKVPFLGSFFDNEVAPEDNPF